MTNFENGVPPEENSPNSQTVLNEPPPPEGEPGVPLWGNDPPEPPRTFAQRHGELIRKANGGRGTLLLICVLSLINVISLYADLNFSFPFGMSMPAILAIIGSSLVSELGSNVISVILVVFAALMLLACFAMWQLSRNYTAPIAVFLGIFTLDTLLLLAFATWLTENPADFLIDFAFHAWALFSIITLLRNRVKLNKLWRAEEGTEQERSYAPPTPPRSKSAKGDGGGKDPWDR